MSDAHAKPAAILATDVPARGSTNYPAEFADRVKGRLKRALGDVFQLKNFGVNLTTLPPGVQSSVRHRHLVQDEFVYVLDGHVTLIDDQGETVLGPGMCAGFPSGGGAHHLVNRSSAPVTYLEIGDRLPNDRADYPDDDLRAEWGGDRWLFRRKDGTPY